MKRLNNILTVPNQLLICFLVVFGSSALAQPTVQKPIISSLTIDECYQWTRENYPLIKQLDIIDKTTQYTLSNASTGNLPQINIKGQATYQSDVTELPFDLPNVDIPSINKDQYKIYGEVFQPLTNYGRVNAGKKLIEHNGEIEKQQVEVDLYKLKDRINQIFFGVHLYNEKIEQFQIIQSDLDSALVKVEAAIANGTATLIDKQLLNVERISLNQQVEESKANQLAFLKMLSTLTGKNITESTRLIKPSVEVLPTTISRPELQLFNLQSQSVALKQKQINNTLLPNIGLFAQGGYGRPALNFLSNEFDFYYIGGLRLNWNLSHLYTFRNTKRSLDLLTERIAIQQGAFMLNTSLTQSQQSAEVTKYQSLIQSDKEIIQIREQVLETAKVQLANGLITTIDYVKHLNDVNKARQTLILHDTQLLLALFNLKTTVGK